MSVTLSQSIERPANVPSFSPPVRILFAIGILVLLAMVIACDRVEIENGNDLEPPVSTHFEWPDDVTHPSLTLEVEYHLSNESGDGMDKGEATIEIELMPELGPATVAHVIDLAENGYYDGWVYLTVFVKPSFDGIDIEVRCENPDGSLPESLEGEDLEFLIEYVAEAMYDSLNKKEVA